MLRFAARAQKSVPVDCVRYRLAKAVFCWGSEIVVDSRSPKLETAPGVVKERCALAAKVWKAAVAAAICWSLRATIPACVALARAFCTVSDGTIARREGS